MKKAVVLLGSIATLLFGSAVASESCSLIVYSSKDFHNAKQEQDKYKNKKFKNVKVLKNEQNNMFMVSVADLDKKVSHKILSTLVQMKKIPSQSICSDRPYYKQVENYYVEEKINKELKEYKSTKKEIIELYNTTDAVLQNLLKLPEQEATAKYGKLIQNLFSSKAQLIKAYNNIDNSDDIKLDLTKKEPKDKGYDIELIIPKKQKSQKEIEEKIARERKIKEAKQMLLNFNDLIRDYKKVKKDTINIYNKNNGLLSTILQSIKPLKEDISVYVGTIKTLSSNEKELIKQYKNIINTYKSNIETFKLINKTKEVSDFLNMERTDMSKISKKIQEMNAERLCVHERINCKEQ